MSHIRANCTFGLICDKRKPRTLSLYLAKEQQRGLKN